MKSSLMSALLEDRQTDFGQASTHTSRSERVRCVVQYLSTGAAVSGSSSAIGKKSGS